MKNIITTICFVISFAFAATAQSITATAAQAQLGKSVIVLDSVYNVKIYNDTTAVLDMGGKGKKAVLNVIYISKHGLDKQFYKSLKEGKIEVSGTIVNIAMQPTLIIRDENKLQTYTALKNRKYLPMAQISQKSVVAGN